MKELRKILECIVGFGWCIKAKCWGGKLPLKQRLNVFFLRLWTARPAKNAEEALLLIDKVLTEVENEFSGVPELPHPGLVSNGRMYPPQKDMIKSDESGGLIAKTRGHVINIKSNGTMIFYCRRTYSDVNSTVLFVKKGARRMEQSDSRASKASSKMKELGKQIERDYKDARVVFEEFPSGSATLDVTLREAFIILEYRVPHGFGLSSIAIGDSEWRSDYDEVFDRFSLARLKLLKMVDRVVQAPRSKPRLKNSKVLSFNFPRVSLSLNSHAQMR